MSGQAEDCSVWTTDVLSTDHLVPQVAENEFLGKTTTESLTVPRALLFQKWYFQKDEKEDAYRYSSKAETSAGIESDTKSGGIDSRTSKPLGVSSNSVFNSVRAYLVKGPSGIVKGGRDDRNFWCLKL